MFKRRFYKAAPFLAIAILCFAGPAFAQENVGSLAAGLTDQVSNVTKLIAVVSYMLGIGAGLTAGLKFKAHSENPNQPPLKVPLMYSAVAAMLIALPSFLGAGATTLFGSDVQYGDAETGEGVQL